MRIFTFVFCLLFLCANVQAEYSFGNKYQVKNDALEFETKELFINGKLVGYIYNEAAPTKFSDDFYVYASCPTDKHTAKPDGYCTNWKIYDTKRKVSSNITFSGLGFFSEPSFHWPYIAFVQVPQKISKENFQSGLVKVSCVVFEWTKKKLVARKDVLVNVGHFETDAPGSFHPPQFTRNENGLSVSCLEDDGQGNGNVITIVPVHEAK